MFESVWLKVFEFWKQVEFVNFLDYKLDKWSNGVGKRLVF